MAWTAVELMAALGVTPGTATYASNTFPQNAVGDIVYSKLDYVNSPPANNGKAIQIEYTIKTHRQIELLYTGTPAFADASGTTQAVCTSLVTSPWYCDLIRNSDGALIQGIHESNLLIPGSGAGTSTTQEGFTTFIKAIVGTWTP